MEGHHQQVVVTSGVCSWKPSSFDIVHSRSEALPHWNVINPVVVLFIWAMPGQSSRGFVMAKCVRQLKVVKGGRLQDSGSSLICVVLAEGPANALPVFISVLATFAFQSPGTTRMFLV